MYDVCEVFEDHFFKELCGISPWDRIITESIHHRPHYTNITILNLLIYKKSIIHSLVKRCFFLGAIAVSVTPW